MNFARRIIGRIFSTLLVALAILTCLAGFASHTRQEKFEWYGPPYPCAKIRQAWVCICSRGAIALAVQTHTPESITPFPYAKTGFSHSSDRLMRDAGAGVNAKPKFGFGIIDYRLIPTRGLVVPAWFLATVFAVIPSMRNMRMARSRRRVRRGLCGECGYDLRGSPGRCPECGLAPKRRNDYYNR